MPSWVWGPTPGVGTSGTCSRRRKMDLMGPKLDPPLEAAAPAASSTTIAKPILCRTVWKFPCGLGERQTPCPLLLALRPWPPFFFTLSLAHTRPGVLCLAGLGRGLCGVVCRSACLPARPSARLSGHHRQPSLASAAQHTAHSTQPARSYLPNSPKLPRSYQRCVSSGSANVPTSPDRPANCRGEELDSPAPLPLQEKKKPQLAMSDVAWLSLNEIDCLSAI